MYKRLVIYLGEMYPVVSRLLASLGLFAGIYATTLFLEQKSFITAGYTEIIGVLTVFAVLLSLRIVDEFKDAETDKVNFPNRPLPSGRVKTADLITLLVVVVVLMVVANLVFMPNRLFFVAIFVYGALMSVWFFARTYIQPSLILALVTHNPIQLLIVYYVISIAAVSYDFSVFTLRLLLVALIFYIPGLAWELSRKIRAKREENQYVTYSRIFGRGRAILIVVALFFVQVVAVTMLFSGQAWWIVAVAWVLYAVYAAVSIINIKKPEYINYGKIARAYLYIFQGFIATVSIIAIV